MKLTKPIRVSEAAEFLDASIKGNKDQEITGINEIHKVQSGDLTFVDVPKYYSKALQSAATIILINAEVEVPENKTLIISDDPFRDYNRLVQLLKPEEKPAKEHFFKGSRVSIGENTAIYPGVSIGNDVHIGNDCTIFPNVVLYDNTVIGDRVILHAGTIIGAHAYYYKNRGTHFEKLISCGSVIIQNDVEIGAGCTIDKGVSGDTIIGEHTKLDNQVHVGHGVEIGKKCLIGAQVAIGGKVIIGDEVTIWGQAGITKDVRIGSKVTIAAQSGVSKSLEAGKVYFGTPAQEIHRWQREMAWLRGQSRKKE